MNDQPERTAAAPVPMPAARARRLDPRLLGLNIALLVVLAAFSVRGAPDLQGNAGRGADQPARGRGEYTLISARVQGSSTHAVFILDAANHELVALGWDRNKNRLEPVGHRDLAADAVFFKGSR